MSRDDAAGELTSVIVGARDAFDGVYAPVSVEVFGFPRAVGTTHVDLVRQGDHLTGKLLEPDRPLPAPRFGGEGSEPGVPGEDPDAVEPGEGGPSEGQPAEPAPGG